MSTELTASQENLVRSILYKFLKNILDEIPNDNDEIKNKRGREEFTYLYKSLVYKAPELLLGYFTTIRETLIRVFPIDEDDTKNPQWKKNILKMWTESCLQLDEEILHKSKYSNQSEKP